MSYTSSKIDWDEDYELTTDEQNRIEGNIKALAEENMTITGDKTFTGGFTANGVQSNITSELIESWAVPTGSFLITYGSIFTILKPCSIFGKYTGTATSGVTGTASVRLQIQCEGIWVDYGEILASYTPVLATGSQSAEMINPGTYRILRTQPIISTSTLVMSVAIVGKFGDDSI